MVWFIKLEKSIAGKLAMAFTDAKTLADRAGEEVKAAEAALESAKQKAADLSKAAHEAAQAALANAKQETARLLEEAKAAEAKATYHARQAILPTITSTVIAPVVEVDETPAVMNPPSVTVVTNPLQIQ
jgi:F0F1-type ATP synthase membrane subunit b/b'